MSPEIVEVKFLQLSFASFGTLGLNLSFVIKYRTDETYIYIYIYIWKKNNTYICVCVLLLAFVLQ